MKALNNLSVDQIKNVIIVVLIAVVFFLLGASGIFGSSTDRFDLSTNYQSSQIEGEMITIGGGHPGYDGD